MVQGNSEESAQPGMLPEGYTVSDDELRQMQAQQGWQARDPPRRERSTGMERSKARNWYWWLWLSPLLTLPTLVFLMAQYIGYDVVCPGVQRDCNWPAAERVTILVAVLGSALWHLVLLFAALNKEHPFVGWHGRQALLLAGVRTVVPLGFGLAFGADYGALVFIPVQIVIWFAGTLWGQRQAARGDCSLMRWFGQEELLSTLREADVEIQVREQEAQALVEIVRFSRDPAERDRAVEELSRRGMVEAL